MRKNVSDMYTAGGLEIQRYHQPPSIYEYYSNKPSKVLIKGSSLKTQFLLKSYVGINKWFGNFDIPTPISDDLEDHILTLPASLDLDQHSVNMVLASIKMGER